MAHAGGKQKYRELADHLRRRIRSGELKVGDRLPSYTELYEQCGASTATVQRACDVLDQEQLIERRQGSGVFVAEPQRQRTGNIGFIGSASFISQESPFTLRLMGAVHRAIAAQQRHLLYLGTEKSWDVRAADKVDGVLICGVEEETDFLRELPLHLPCVSALTSLEGVASVSVDGYRGGQMAVRHLMDLGHRRIACLMEKQAWEARRRFAGYNDALQERGVEVDSHWMRLVAAVDNGAPGQPYLAWAREHMKTWLRDGWDETRCTAILVQNDVAAIGVIQVLQEEGIKVPEQVSVMGFDGTELCDLVSPRLCSVALPLAEIGARAMAILDRQIAGDAFAAETILLPLSLRDGESVAVVKPA